MNIYALSELGLVRKNNEDCYLIDDEVFYKKSYKGLNKNHQTFAVFDGLGGRNAGEVASFNSAKFLATYVKKIINNFPKMVIDINKALLNLAKTKAEYDGMATTIAGLTIQDNFVHVYNLGDSIIYRIRNEEIKELTEEHSYRNVLLSEGASIEVANQFRHKMTKCLGQPHLYEKEVSYTKLSEGIKSNDLYILTTDGITDLLESHEILKFFINNKVEEAIKEIVKTVINRGARDNYTMIVIEI